MRQALRSDSWPFRKCWGPEQGSVLAVVSDIPHTTTKVGYQAGIVATSAMDKKFQALGGPPLAGLNPEWQEKSQPQ